MSELGDGDPMLQFFEFEHLPAHLQQVSAPFGALATKMVNTLPRNPERTTALRKLLEAKDCASIEKRVGGHKLNRKQEATYAITGYCS